MMITLFIILFAGLSLLYLAVNVYASNDTAQTNMTTYENKTLGIAFEYPADWEIFEDYGLLSDKYVEILVHRPTTDVSGMTSEQRSATIQSNLEAMSTMFDVLITNVSQNLDPNTLQLIPFSAQDECNNHRVSLSDRTVETTSIGTPSAYWLSNKIGKDEPIKIGNVTGCRIDSIENHDNVQKRFDIDIFVVNNNKLYKIGFSTDPINVPSIAPIGEKMIQSFRFLNTTK